MKKELASERWIELGCGGDFGEDPRWFYIDLVRYPGVPEGKLSRLVLGDISNLPFAAGSFQYARMQHVIEHMDRPRALRSLLECRRVLTLNGRLEVLTPNARCLGYALWEIEDIDDIRLGTPFSIPVKFSRDSEATGPPLLEHLLGRYCGHEIPDPDCHDHLTGDAQQHRYLYNAHTLKKVMLEAGFSNVKVEGHQDWMLLGKGEKCREW